MNLAIHPLAVEGGSVDAEGSHLGAGFLGTRVKATQHGEPGFGKRAGEY